MRRIGGKTYFEGLIAELILSSGENAILRPWEQRILQRDWIGAASTMELTPNQAEPLSPHWIGRLRVVDGDQKGITVNFDNGASLTFWRVMERWRVRLVSPHWETSISESATTWLTSFTASLGTLASTLDSGFMWRMGFGVEFWPEAPIAGAQNHLVVTSREAVEAAYARPEVFWRAWDAVEQQGDRFLCTRALDAIDDLAFAKRVAGPSWELAYAAKPKLTKYRWVHLTEQVLPLFNAGDGFLKATGYHPGQKLVEYAAHVPEGEHLRPWEIFRVRDVRAKKKLPDGKPVDSVRVVFWDAAMAEREKRPLLDIDVDVYYQGRDGQLVAVTDPGATSR